MLQKKRFLAAFVLLVLTFTAGSLLSRDSKQESSPDSTQQLNENPITQESSNNPNVLGHQYRAPQIYISGGEQGYSTGGMISLASTDEPAVHIGGYNISGEAEITMYEANEDALLDYLTHDKDGKQTKKTPDIDRLRLVTSVKHTIRTGTGGVYGEGSKITLPLGERGIWYLAIKLGPINTGAYVLRSNIGVLTKEGDNEFIFWGQYFKTKRSISDGSVKVYNLQDGRNELQAASFNSEGIAKASLNAQADIAFISQGDDRAVVPLNLKYLNSSYGENYREFQPKSRKTRYFIFTDRPLYKPGDTVYFKAVLRDDDDARYTIPGGEVLVKIYHGYYYEGSQLKPDLEKSYPISPDGTVSGQYQLSADAKTGYYTLSITIPGSTERISYWDYDYSSNTISFDVEFFRKPEFSVEVSAPKTEVIAGEKTSFTISGQYFSGQPLRDQSVKYTVYSADFYEYEYVSDQQYLAGDLSSDYRYGWYGSTKVTEGSVVLNEEGEALIDLDTNIPGDTGKSQVFSIEATIDDGSVEPSFSRKNILVHAGEFGIFRKDASYGTKVNTQLALPIKLVFHRSTSKVSGIQLTAKVHRENWVAYQEETQKYPSYRKEEEDLSPISTKTGDQGDATFTLTPTKTGSYTFTVDAKDARGNGILKVFYSYVSADDYPFYSAEGHNDITIATDKQKYLPSDTVSFSIFSQIPDRDVLLSLERGRVQTFQVVSLNGKSGTVEVPLVDSDIPNIYAKVASFSDSTFDSGQIKVVVSSESKKLVVNVTPNSNTYGPGETVTVNVETTDSGGNPKAAELALWAVDKAIFELYTNSLGDIFDTFWHERSNSTQEAHSLEGILVYHAEGGGCFASGTPVLMADGSLKNIENISIGDYVLTRSEKDARLVQAKVLRTHLTSVSGYLTLNGNLKVTENHIMRVNNAWKEAGSIQVGDKLISSIGQEVAVTSIEWQRGTFDVYNLEIEKYHTYFAGGVWVHNQKGNGARIVFKDTAYWNPSVHTDTSGRAQVSFKLPDNLTTWTIAAVGSTVETNVGQTTNEIVVTKDVIVRPILPNILREGDEVVLSALVQNFTENDQTFDVDLAFDAGDVQSATHSAVPIVAKDTKQLYWNVSARNEKDKAKLTFSARSRDQKDASDTIVQEIPVWAFGFVEQRGETGDGPKSYKLALSQDSNKEKSKVTLSLSPTLIGSLPTAMKYLIHYPYGCVEQTTSSFVPAVIVRTNQDIFAEALKDNDVDDIIKKGLSRLAILQQGDGGWAWWTSGKSDAFITAYVVEYLLEAKQAGFAVDDEMLLRAQGYLERQDQPETPDDTIAKIYALSLLSSQKKTINPSNFDNVSPDILSLAVMANFKNGDSNPETNGLARLIGLAKPQGDALTWQAGSKERFASIDASTALAVRAIVTAGGNRDIAAKGIRYLSRSRNNYYWSNTFATSQTIRAIVDFAKTGSELTPNYAYTVTLDTKEIARGAVSSTTQTIKDIEIPVNNIQSNGSTVAIAKNGDGQIYSTLLISEFHQDRKAKAVEGRLSVSREYISEKGEQYSLAVGDTVTVRITVGGVSANENYAVIADELPAGLVPINESFKNVQYGQNPYDYYYYSYDVTDREVTENGMVLTLYQIAPGERTYIYRARVVSEGSFIVPPVTASLMYAPDVYGRSAVQNIKTTKESEILPGKAIQKTVVKQKPQIIGIVVLFTLVLIAGIIKLRKQGVTIALVKEKIRSFVNRDQPPQPPMPGTTINGQ